MTSRFCELASGSSGNCAFLQSRGFGLLIDIGLGPRYIGRRLATIGASWRDVNAVLLTHAHSDHWKDTTLTFLRQSRIPFYCAREQEVDLDRGSGSLGALKAEGLVRHFRPGESFALAQSLACKAIPVPHDADPTFAFRIDGPEGLYGPIWSLGYASDLGEAPPTLLDAFQDVSLLAIEFNHCERLERQSRRPRFLVERVLGPLGHLSNDQACEAVRAILQRSAPHCLRQLVQLHLSRDCNRPTLAAGLGKGLLSELGSNARVTTAQQFAPSPALSLEGEPVPRRPARAVVPESER